MEEFLIHGSLVFMSTIFSYCISYKLIPVVADYLLKNTNLSGIDMGKRNKPRVPESLGTLVGFTYLTTFLIFFIIAPILLVSSGLLSNISLSERFCISSHNDGANGFNNNLSYIAAISTISAMLVLGFIDDVYDLRWRYKLLFPFGASIPLLSVYYYSYGDRTTVLVPQIVANYLNLDDRLNLGAFYYVYMLMFVIFCTNAVNIYAGINGLEVGQSIILTVTVVLYNVVEITTKADCDEVHVFSLQLLLPFLFCSCALYKYNRYPASVFVGDSYCYFAGMTLAVVGILGHFSEEILMFAIPQVLNFLVSIPQIFKIVPCPRHRLPKFNEDTGLREPSTFTFQQKDLNFLGRVLIKIYSSVGLCKITTQSIKSDDQHDDTPEDRKIHRIQHFTANNLTLINLWLVWFGPKNERDLCHQLLRFQSWLSFLALAFLTVKMLHE